MTSVLASVILSLIYIGCTAEIQSCQSGYAVLVPCHTTANDLIPNITDVYCPSGCLNKELTVWGTDVYTESSPICLAAIHAGLASNGGGYVTVEKMPGQSKYNGSTKNALTSLSYNMSISSFKLSTTGTDITILADSASSYSAMPTTINAGSKISTRHSTSTTAPNVSTTPATTAQSVTTVTNITTTNSTISVSKLSTSLNATVAANASNSTNATTTAHLNTTTAHLNTTTAHLNTTTTTTSTTSKSALALTSTSTTSTASTTKISSASVSCYTTANDLIGDPVTILCPASCNIYPLVFGTDIYTSGSDLCASAIHNGKITKAGGYATFTRKPEESYYYGSSRNGIDSYDSSDVFGDESIVFI